VVEQWTENPRVGSSILPLGTSLRQEYFLLTTPGKRISFLEIVYEA